MALRDVSRRRYGSHSLHALSATHVCVTRLCPPFLAALWPLPELQEEVDIPVRRPRQTQFGVSKSRKCVVPFAGLDRRIPLVVDDSLEVVDDVLEGWALQPSSEEEEQAQQRDGNLRMLWSCMGSLSSGFVRAVSMRLSSSVVTSVAALPGAATSR